MNTYIGLFVVSTFAAVVLTPLVRRACQRVGWLDLAADGRRIHLQPVPRLGGVAIFASVALSLLALTALDNLVTQQVREYLPRLAQTLVPAALVFAVGLYDDVWGAGARVKFGALGVAATLFFFMGGRVEALSVPLVGTVELPEALSYVVTLVWMVGVANAFNLIDGVDGLAAGAALFASLVMLVVALLLGHPPVAAVACVLCGALVGFLRYNFNPASIFLGDCGALFVGFTLAGLSVHGAQKASTAVAVAIPVLAFGVPMVDTGFTLVRRFLSGRPLFEGDREHIHHMLLARGWSQRRVAFVLYGACALFGLVALLFVHDSGGATGLMLLIVCAAVALGVGRLRYHEVDEIKASVRRGLNDRRLRASHNIRVRRAVRAMSNAQSLGTFFDAVRVLLEVGEFVYARVQLGDGPVGRRAAEALLARDAEGSRRHRLVIEDGLVCWSWERGDVDAEVVSSSGRFWTLRLPLSTERGTWGYINLYRGFDSDELLLDINYLCHLFQRETGQAAERIFAAAIVEETGEDEIVSLAYSSGD
ncbi:MAG TPA: MraY family glycosyltransferase [Pyrinomonadaceae bacterium]